MQRRLRLAPALLLSATAILAPRIVRADDGDLAHARALFEEAGELERRGQWAPAQEKLRAALRIRETPHLHYALGWALENDDKLLEAATEYEMAVRLAQHSHVDEVLRLATVRLGELERATPVVQVRVDGGAADAVRVVVDGRATTMQSDVVSMPVNPGSRVVRVERPGHAPVEQLVYVPRGTTRVVEAHADEPVASRTGSPDRHALPEPAAPAPQRHGGGAPVLPIALAAGGTALAIGGGILFASSASDAATRDDSMRRWCEETACVGGTTATRPESTDAAAQRQAAVDAAERGNTKQIVGAVVGGVGVIGAAIGVYMLVKGGHERTEERTVPTPTLAPVRGGAIAGAVLRF